MKRTYKEKRKNKHIIAVIGLIFAMCIGSGMFGMFGMSGTAATASQMNAMTPLARHGRLSVKGVDRWI